MAYHQRLVLFFVSSTVSTCMACRMSSARMPPFIGVPCTANSPPPPLGMDISVSATVLTLPSARLPALHLPACLQHWTLPAAKLMGVGAEGGLWRVLPEQAPCSPGMCAQGGAWQDGAGHGTSGSRLGSLRARACRQRCSPPEALSFDDEAQVAPTVASLCQCSQVSSRAVQHTLAQRSTH